MTPQTTTSLFPPLNKTASAPAPVRSMPAPKRASVPEHVAVVAECSAGAAAALEALDDCAEAGLESGVRCLSVLLADARWAERNDADFAALLRALAERIGRNAPGLAGRGIQFKIIGQRPARHARLYDALCRAAETPRRHVALEVALAVNYDGRADLLQAVRRLARDAAEGRADPSALNAAALAQRQLCGGLPPVDLMIRTGGRTALSHFLLWNAAYAELLFTDAPWAEFRARQFHLALDDYARRRRTFGALPKSSAR